MRQYGGPILLASLMVAGCTGAPEPPHPMNVTIPLEIVSWEELQGWIGDQQGKVVVIDVWSTFCLTCIEEFPHFVSLHQNYGNQIACASLNINFYGGPENKPVDARPQVLKFLTAKKATMQNFISSDPDEIVLQHLDAGSIPIAMVYDPSGKLHTVFTNDHDQYGPAGFSYKQQITPLVDQLLQTTQR